MSFSGDGRGGQSTKSARQSRGDEPIVLLNKMSVRSQRSRAACYI
jgi:hypothetical protein